MCNVHPPAGGVRVAEAALPQLCAHRAPAYGSQCLAACAHVPGYRRHMRVAQQEHVLVSVKGCTQCDGSRVLRRQLGLWWLP